jgi:hypothetical protein
MVVSFLVAEQRPIETPVPCFLWRVKAGWQGGVLSEERLHVEDLVRVVSAFPLVRSLGSDVGWHHEELTAGSNPDTTPFQFVPLVVV